MKRGLVVTVVVAALLAAGGFFYSRSRGEKPTEVDLGRVERRAVFQSFVTASGEIVAGRYADIGSNVMGRLVDLAVAEGDAVRKGSVLARIDPVQAASQASALAAQRDALEAEVSVATAREVEARQGLERARQLRSDGVIAQADLDTAVAAADSARAQLEAARRRVAQGKAQLSQARDSLAKTEITAPIDGVVTRLNVREGEMVVIGLQNQPGSILMTLSDLATVNAEVRVAEAEVLRLRVGQKATVTLEAVPNRTFAGRVTEIGASALPVTGTGAAAREFRVVVRLDAPDPSLRPGLTCDVRILADEIQNALTLPLQAVVLRPDARGEERQGVFVVDPATGGTRFTPVETGVIGGLDVEVKGLAVGTSVVLGPFQTLRDLKEGARVKGREPEKK